VPIVFLTALSGLGTHHSATGSGGDDLLTKPINRTELLLRVRSLLRIRRMSRYMHTNLEVIAAQRDALVEAQHQREELMSFIVHDLKNPLASILANSQSLRGDGWSLDDAREVLGDVETAARSMLRMVLNLLDVSRGDSGAMVLKPQLTDMAQLIDGVLTLMRPRFIERSLLAAVDVGETCVEIDAEVMRRIVENLVDNCVKHSPARGTISIRAAETAGRLELRVSDEGPGIPVDLREKIFEKYVQLAPRDGVEAAPMGRGLGLAFCRLAAEAHGGHIWVEANPPHGTTFAVRIPAAPKPKTFTESRPRAEASASDGGDAAHSSPRGQ
jgi:signal transduction histidine kinase